MCFLLNKYIMDIEKLRQQFTVLLSAGITAEYSKKYTTSKEEENKLKEKIKEFDKIWQQFKDEYK